MQHGKDGYDSAGDGGIDGHWVKFIDWNGNQDRLADGPKLAADSSDATKITYFTPRVGGLQAGVSFTPDTNAKGQKLSTDTTGGFENTWGFGVNFVKKVGGASVAVSAVGHVGNAEDKKTAKAANLTEVIDGKATDITFEGREDLHAWAVGASVGYGAWSVGGGYSDSGDGGEATVGGDGDATSWHVGGAYTQGPVSIGLSYLHAEVDVTGGSDEGDAIVGAVNYTVGGGARVFVEVSWFDTDDANDSTKDYEGVGFVLGSAVKF